jgi:single-stranded-DNA-specific exonuclease
MPETIDAPTIVSLTIPTSKLRARTPDTVLQQAAIAQGLHPLLARILASRPQPENTEFNAMLDPKLSCLEHPLKMMDMLKASKRVADAIMNKEVIGIETDHDCDGQTSHAVLFHNLVHKFGHPESLLRSYIGHRLTEGYGLSAKVAARIVADDPKPSLIITADNGSADEPRIAQLVAAGIEVIVTDHHQLPIAGPPLSALACLNPTRDDCDYTDPYIAGCMVAWLLMAATRLELIDRGYLAADFPKLTDSLDFVAVGTVADCVSMARSQNNRAIVTYGLKLINTGIKPCWQAVKALVKGNITAEDLGFKVGPLLNSDGRLASAFGSVSFLLAADDRTAQEWIAYLQEQNQLRKGIQNTVTSQGMLIAAQQTQAGRFSLCIFLADGHAGVHGISASRIKDSFGRPTVFLAPKQGEEELLTGSIRGIANFHVGDALQWIIRNNPDLLVAGGGHAGAGGVTLKAANYQLFFEQFELATRQQLVSADLGPVIWTDGAIEAQWLNIDILETIAQLEPFGREFEAPVFELQGVLQNLRVIGDGTHARVEIAYEKQHLSGVWFNFRQNSQQPLPVQIGDNISCAFMLKANDFGGVRRCEIQVVALSKIVK